MLSVFLSMVKGNRIALVEMSESGCFRQAEIIRTSLNRLEYKKYNKRVSTYTNLDNDGYAELVSQGYSYIITDFGHDYEANRQLFLLCNIKLVVGSMSWWKLQHFVSFLAITESEGTGKNFRYLANNASEKTKKYLKKEFKLIVKEIPYEADPYELSGESLLFLEKLLFQRT